MDSRGKSRVIRDALVTELTQVQYLGEPAFMEVSGSTKGQFKGYPAMRVMPGRFANDATGMGETERTVTFDGIVHIEVESNGDSEDDPLQDAIDKMLDLTELIADQLDDADFNNRLDDHEPGLNALQISTETIDWDFLAGDAGTMLLFVVRMSVRYSKELNFDA